MSFMFKDFQVISVSRRTDIPAYYADWFVERLKLGYTAYPNPFSGKPVYVNLNPQNILAFVFWTRNPAPLIKHLDFIDSLYQQRHYMHVTLNGMPKALEARNPKVDFVIDKIRYLSDRYGKHYIQWRFDPIVLSSATPKELIIENFQYIAEQLKGYVEKCIFSFVDLYKKTEINFNKLSKAQKIEFYRPDEDMMISISKRLYEIAKECNIGLFTCCQKNLEGKIKEVPANSCIDSEIIKKITHINKLNFKEVPTREGCHCIASKDIGYYDSCPHGCIYCYANKNPDLAKNNAKNYRLSGFPMDDFMKGSNDELLF